MRVLMIDDGLKDWSGHNASYAMAVLDEMSRTCIESELFVSRDIAQVQGTRVNIHPAFRRFAAGLFFNSGVIPSSANRAARFLFANWSHMVDLFRNVTANVGNGDIILVLIASTRTTLAYAAWLRWLLIRKRRVAVVFVLHNAPHAQFKMEARLIARISGQRLLWAAHTRHVRDMCTSALGHDAFLLPLPLGATVIAQPVSRATGSPAAFSYLGVAGFTKGLDILVAAIDHLSDLLQNGRLKLLVQFNIHIPNERLEALRQKLLTLADGIPGIVVLSGPLAAAEYEQEMRKADVILIPHRREYYRYALSGIFTEALSMGKPVVVAADTYMAEELKTCGAGVCFEDGNPRSFAYAIRSALEDIENLNRRAVETRSAWRDIHSAERYVTELASMAMPTLSNGRNAD